MGGSKKKEITEHGMSMYRQRGCRCEICSAAAAAERRKYRPVKQKIIYLDSELFIQRMEKDGYRPFINNEQIARWKKSGKIELYSADRWCCKFGYHPTEIWGDDFYQGAFDEEQRLQTTA